ncbi:hypothetical protein C0J52_12909 [Blattella germanica]|nr:hypothetical protein C0J52_12909 [Blattella germanica]
MSNMFVCCPSCCKHSSIVQGLTFRSFHVISHCFLDIPSSEACLHVELDRRLFYRSSDSSTCFFSCLVPSTLQPVFNTAKSKSASFPIENSRSVAFRGGALLNFSWNAPIICAINSKN